MLGLVTALSLALVATPDPTTLSAIQPTPAVQSDTRILASIRETVAGTETGSVLAVLATGFSEDYAAFEQRMLARARTGTLDAAAMDSMAAEFASMMMTRHLSRVVEARTEDLVALSSVRLEMMKALQQGHAAACHEFVEAGLSPDRIAELGLGASHGLETLSRAVIALIAQPPRGVTHSEPPITAWETIGRRYAELGGNPAWVAALFGDRNYTGQSHGERCASAVLWETAVSEAAPEVRAYYISALYVAPQAPATVAPQPQGTQP
tara:strand:+ start:260 stop:1057 length:798 start_codon:yes stop_codon:yes gene_type:complete